MKAERKKKKNQKKKNQKKNKKNKDKKKNKKKNKKKKHRSKFSKAVDAARAAAATAKAAADQVGRADDAMSGLPVTISRHRFTQKATDSKDKGKAPVEEEEEKEKETDNATAQQVRRARVYFGSHDERLTLLCRRRRVARPDQLAASAVARTTGAEATSCSGSRMTTAANWPRL